MDRLPSSADGYANSEFAINYSRHKASMPRLVPIGTGLLTKPEVKFDTMVYFIHCVKHNTVAVYEDASATIKWLPFTPLFPEKSWTESCIVGTLLILCNDHDDLYQSMKQSPPIASVQLLEILRVQQPQTLNFLTRIIFYIRLKDDAPSFECCAPIACITWLSLEKLASSDVTSIWGPEIVQYSHIIQSNFVNFNERLEEFSLDDVYLYAPRDPPRNAEETMMLELGISEKTIEVLYNDFLDHCFPCFSMPYDSFKHYFSKYGLIEGDGRLEALFMAFNYKKTGFVAFHELLMGLVSLEPLASHQETRIKFIFRFYDSGNKGYLDLRDFERMVADMYPALSPDDLQRTMEESKRAIGTTTKEGEACITFGNFMHAIRTHRFRGTSKLCRSSVEVFVQLTRAFSLKKRADSDNREWHNLSQVVLPLPANKEVCVQCSSRRFKLATHSVDLDAKGYVESATRTYTSKENSSAPVDDRSVEFVFNSKSVANEYIHLVRDFNKAKGVVKDPRGLLDRDRQRMYNMMLKLLQEAKPILRAESRCPNMRSPCLVIGDIHGNLEDLLTFERLLWRRLPSFGPNYLFLGDYVDRGKWSVECAVYLLSLKLLDPGKVCLLRGNHEVRPLQEKYTYKKECLLKYGPDIGEKIWQITNQLFDMLPVAATIDSAIFCVHGGLSPNAQTLDQIRAMPPVLENPEQQSKIAWELIWSDPCHMQQYLDLMEIMDVNSQFAHEGYVTNTKRGAAYLFNEHAAHTFLSTNGLSHMIRAHEVPPYGFKHHFINRCTTVFSCSHYCNNENEAACILVDKNRIRCVRIDTHNNAPATL